MARDRFISDNLYNMRERFKRNHAEHLTTPDAVETQVFSSTDPSETNIRDAAPEVVVKEYSAPRLPALSAGDSKKEDNRDRRELEGRLLRDLSFIDAERELICQRNNALEKFRKIAEELLNELNQDGITSRQIDLLRIKYFQAYGRFEAFTAQRGNNTPAAPVQNNSAVSTWPVIAAIAGAAILISLTLCLLFGR